MSREQMLGKTAKEAFAGEYGAALHDFYVRSFASKKPITQEYPLFLGGSKRHMRTVFNPVVDENDTVVRVFSCPLDVTAEYALRGVEARTAAVNKEMEGFISLAAHDLRSPMRRINDIASFLRADLPELSEENSRLLDMLEKVASQSFAMISDLINHAQASEIAGEQEDFETFRLKTLCEQVLQTLDPGQTHHWKVEEAVIFGERLSTQIIIRNLIDNAIKHNADRTLQVSVAVARVDDSTFELVVSDNGRGFSQSDIGQLKGNPLTTGSGFGIAGVMRLVSSRGGVISVDERAEGAGATVRVVLPGNLETEVR